MTTPDPLTESADLKTVAEARIEAQNAAQWLARFTRSYNAGRQRDGDLQLRWDATAQRVTTPEVEPGVALELSLPTLILQFIEHGQPSPHAIDIEGKSSTEVEAWILAELLHRGFDRDTFSKGLPYRWARLMSGDEVKYSPEAHVRELRQIADWFEAATPILQRVKAAVTAPAAGAAGESELLCWPDRLDIGFAVDTSSEGSMRVGFTAGSDDSIRPGYFVRRAMPQVGSDTGLPLSRIAEDAMSPDDVVAALVAMTKDAKMRSAN